MNSFIRRASIVAGATSVALVVGAGAASAHVSVVAPGAEQGGYTVLTFRVPTESDTAATTSVRVELPDLNSARTQPIPGWTATVDKNGDGLATAVTWTAQPGSEVGPGQFQQFLLSAGPLPEEDTVSFPAVQTYDDGQVVEWTEETTGSEEPEHPAPMLSLAAASGSEHGGHGAATTSETGTEASSTSSSDNTARWIAGVALVLGALGAALGLGAAIRGRRS